MSLNILLTNDDGIDAPGLRQLHDTLSEFGNVEVVAPAEDSSGVGRALSFGRKKAIGGGSELEVNWDEFSYEVPYEEHELGYAVEGTPCECVIVGLRAFDGHRPDLVVSGSNPGPNVGVSTFHRSGTVSAVIEAAYLGVPGIAVSSDGTDHTDAVGFAGNLVEHATRANVFDAVDYLNVVVPSGATGVEVTRPVSDYDMDAEFNGGSFKVHYPKLKRVARKEGDMPDGTDENALNEGRASVTPLRLPHEAHEVEALEGLDLE
jgi:5'-nucleotidase